MTRKEMEKFVDKLEDEICKRTDIDSFEEFMVALSKELGSRYVTNNTQPDSSQLRKE